MCAYLSNPQGEFMDDKSKALLKERRVPITPGSRRCYKDSAGPLKNIQCTQSKSKSCNAGEVDTLMLKKKACTGKTV